MSVAQIRKTDVMTVEQNTVELLARADVDMAIATAHRFPRSITAFRQETQAMVTLSESVASECIYALPRDGKVIEGPSARFAEVIASAWGNCRAGARVIAEGPEFITAQGVFHDLQRNVSITFEVQRRITDKHGRRFKPDMIAVTGNAACSIALRNAVLKGIPKAFWQEMYEAARSTAAGNYKSLANRRADAIKAFQTYGVGSDKIFALLGVQGEADISLDHLTTLRGLLTAIKDGETTPEEAFSIAAPEPRRPPRPPEPPKEAATAADPEAVSEESTTDLPDEQVIWDDETGEVEAEEPAILRDARQAAGQGARKFRFWCAKLGAADKAAIEPHMDDLRALAVEAGE